MRGRKGQVSMEYLVIVGIASLIILPLLVLFLMQMNDVTESMTLSQLNKIGDELVSSANEVYYLGEPAQNTLSFYLPGHVDEIYSQDEMLVMVVSLRASSFSIVKYAAIDLDVNISNYPGVHKVKVMAQSNNVSITETS